jgi:hypothetical protein
MAFDELHGRGQRLRRVASTIGVGWVLLLPVAVALILYLFT